MFEENSLKRSQKRLIFEKMWVSRGPAPLPSVVTPMGAIKAEAYFITITKTQKITNTKSHTTLPQNIDFFNGYWLNSTYITRSFFSTLWLLNLL